VREGGREGTHLADVLLDLGDEGLVGLGQQLVRVVEVGLWRGREGGRKEGREGGRKEGRMCKYIPSLLRVCNFVSFLLRLFHSFLPSLNPSLPPSLPSLSSQCPTTICLHCFLSRTVLPPSLPLSLPPTSLPHLQHRDGRVRQLVVQFGQVKKGPA